MAGDSEWKREKRTISHFFRDAKGHPTGGSSWGPGISITWPTGMLAPERGAFIEDLIDIAIERLEFHQEGEHKCVENSAAIDALNGALVSLESRTRGRLERGVEGTYTP